MNETKRMNINVFADIKLRTLMSRLPYVDYLLDLGSSTCTLADAYPYADTKIVFTDLKNSDGGDFQRVAKTHKDNSNFSFIETSCTDLSVFKDDSFDMVTSFNVIEHLTEKEYNQSLQETVRVLKSGGRFVICTPNKTGRKICNTYLAHPGHIEEFTADELIKIVTAHGFIIDKKIAILNVFGTNNTDLRINVAINEHITKAYLTWIECIIIKENKK